MSTALQTVVAAVAFWGLSTSQNVARAAALSGETHAAGWEASVAPSGSWVSPPAMGHAGAVPALAGVGSPVTVGLTTVGTLFAFDSRPSWWMPYAWFPSGLSPPVA